jgi:catechol 2,3-dioxygenase-like lactoylglutathione lyase family enzyme
MLPVFDHVGLAVADLGKATEWYAKALSLSVERTFEIPGAQLRGAMLLHPSGVRLELLERAGSEPGLRAAGPDEAALTRGFGHIAFQVSDVDGSYRELLSAGAQPRVEPRDAPRAGARMAWVADPEGNLIELITAR